MNFKSANRHELQAGRRRSSRWVAQPWSNPVSLLLAAAMASSAAVILALSWDLTFREDEWDVLFLRPGLSAESILDPHNEHLLAGPILFYKAMQATFGMDSAVPYRIASTAVFLVSAGLLFLYLRRRVGEWLALLGAVLILFCGGAFEDLLWAINIQFFVSMAFGLGMLLALDRDDSVSDRLACALLTLSMLCSSLWLAFAAAATVQVGWDRRRLRRSYIVLVPIAFYALWWLGWGHDAESYRPLSNLIDSPRYVYEGFASSLASLLGLAPISGPLTVDGLRWGRWLLVAALALAAWRLFRIGRVPRGLWIALAIGVAFWFLTSLNANVFRPPTASRYQYAGAIFLLLVAGELLRGVRLGIRPLVAAYAVAALAVFGNIIVLTEAASDYRKLSEQDRGGTAGLEIARDTVDPGFYLGSANELLYGFLTAEEYFSTTATFGSPAYTPEELAADGSEPARAQADFVLGAVLPIKLVAVERHRSSQSPAPELVAAGGASVTRDKECLGLELAAGQPSVLRLPVGGAGIRMAPEAEATLRLRRFAAESFPVDAGTVSPGASAVLTVPTDRATRSWELELTGDGRVRVCGSPLA